MKDDGQNSGWVPYQSCALFGALRFFANIARTVCLIYGPSGCVYFNSAGLMNLNGFMDADYPVDLPRIYCTGFSEQNVVFGGSQDLRKAIINLMENNKDVEAVFIFCCCASEIIGEDIDDIIAQMNRIYDNKLCILHVSGFVGNHKDGMRLAGQLLYDRFMSDSSDSNDGSVNLLGDLDRFSRSTAEMRGYLAKVGVEHIRMIPGPTTLTDLRNAGHARLNVVICGNAAMYISRQLETRYHIPAIGGNAAFYGLENSRDSYCGIYEIFGADPSPIIADYKNAKARLRPLISRFRGSSAAVIAGTRRALGYACLLNELGLDVKLVFSECNADVAKPADFTGYADQVLCNTHPDELPALLRELDVDFIFSTLPELAAPLPYIERLWEDFSGFSGALRMAEYICKITSNKKYSMEKGVDTDD